LNKTLALVRRALQVDSRDIRPHLFRVALASVVLFILTTMLMDNWSRSAPGRTLFEWLMQVNYWFVTVAGATFFATAITEEKEERTLSLLKMAGVGGMSLLAGKWIPRLIGALLLILIQLPFTILSITLGGVLWNQIFAAYIALLAHLFLVGNLGLLASVIAPRIGSACGYMLIALLLYHFGPWIVESGFSELITRGFTLGGLCYLIVEACAYVYDSLALWQLFSISATGFNKHWFSYQVQSNLIAGSVFLFFAWLLFEPFTKNEVDPDAPGVMEQLRSMGWKWQGRPWSAAMVWKDFNYISQGLSVLLVKLTLYLLLGFGMCLYFEDWNISRIDADELGACYVAIWIFTAIIEGAGIATRVYRNEMVGNTWAVLTLLPISLPEIAYGKLFGALLGLVPSFSCMFASMILNPDDWGDFVEGMFTEADAFLAVSYFILQVFTGLHLACYLSISSRWAVWPLSIFMAAFIVFMFNMMVIACLSAARGPEEGILFLMCCAGVALNITGHVMVSRRLHEMQAE